MTTLEPDRDQIEIFTEALFRHAGRQGWVSLRAFFEDDSAKPFRINPTSLAGGLRFLIDVAEDDARRAANNPRPVVFCPPLAVFANRERAGERDIAAGLVLSVECDQRPQEARDLLEQLLDPATVVVRSGGRWSDPTTGEVHDKLHLHWRLAQPAYNKEDLAKLKQARDLAARLVGGDPSNKPVCHPIRWPGSWHRKAEPRLCEILAVNPDNELELNAAHAALVLSKNLHGGHAEQSETGARAGDDQGADWATLIDGILAGAALHASLTQLAMKLLTAGMADGAAVRMLRH